MNYRFKLSSYLAQLSFVLIVISILFILCTSCDKHARLKVREEACRNYLKLLYKALQKYNDDHASFPIKLDVLFDGNYIDNKRFLYCPNTDSKPYIYYMRNCTISANASPKPIIMDKSGFHKDCLNILYSNGSIVDGISGKIYLKPKPSCPKIKIKGLKDEK